MAGKSSKKGEEYFEAPARELASSVVPARMASEVWPNHYDCVRVSVQGNRRSGKTVIAAAIAHMIHDARGTVAWLPEHDSHAEIARCMRLAHAIKLSDMKPVRILMREDTVSPEMRVCRAAFLLLEEMRLCSDPCPPQLREALAALAASVNALAHARERELAATRAEQSSRGTRDWALPPHQTRPE